VIEVVDATIRGAGIAKEDIAAVAATHGPGLIGSLLVGLSFGKAFALGRGIPFAGVNHLEGHLYSNFLTGSGLKYPFVSLIVSGGHTMLVYVSAPLRHRLLGQTRDDAAGEAFDKVAKMLGLGYPGGPIIDRLAREGNPEAIRFPRVYLDDRKFEFSFSGIKTAVLYHLRGRGVTAECGSSLNAAECADVCASFQAAVVDVLVRKTLAAAAQTGVSDIAVSGGVSANTALRNALAREVEHTGRRLHVPPPEYCMDNGAMIAYAGMLRLRLTGPSPLDLPAVANIQFEEAA
jgi:N6-L-threonylcarbamoyladenine synthase